jgi:hypothetical protein
VFFLSPFVLSLIRFARRDIGGDLGEPGGIAFGHIGDMSPLDTDN